MENNVNYEGFDYSTPYISKEEYLANKGVDLSIELQNNDNQQNKVDRFIHDITNYVMDWLVDNYGCNELNRVLHDFSDLKEFRRKRFHLGMMEQIEYILNNGLLHQDSGVNVDTGMIMDLSNVTISRSAFEQFRLGAFCNIKREW